MAAIHDSSFASFAWKSTWVEPELFRVIGAVTLSGNGLGYCLISLVETKWLASTVVTLSLFQDVVVRPRLDTSSILSIEAVSFVRCAESVFHTPTYIVYLIRFRLFWQPFPREDF